MIPKYMQVYAKIKEAVQKGKYAANEMLPSGEVLAKQYECSVLTVKKAMDRLVNEGLVVRKRGLGSFVKKCSTALLSEQGVPVIGRDLIREDVTSIVERFEVTACTAELADKMNINEGDFVYEIERVRLYNQEPRVVEYTWMPLQIIPGLQLKDVETSIYAYIEKQLHKHIQSAHLSFQAVRPKALEKKYFKMDDHDFVCQVLETAYLDTSKIFEYSIACHHPQYFRFETNVVKELYDN